MIRDPNSLTGFQPLAPAADAGLQGQPLTSFAFALTLDPILKEVDGILGNGVIRAIQDDMCMVGPSEKVLEAIAVLQNRLSEVRAYPLPQRWARTVLSHQPTHTHLPFLNGSPHPPTPLTTGVSSSVAPQLVHGHTVLHTPMLERRRSPRPSHNPSHLSFESTIMLPSSFSPNAWNQEATGCSKPTPLTSPIKLL